jgi:hypothetical protein
MLGLAEKYVPGATFVPGDLRDLGAALGEFDAVVSFFALLMLSRDEIPVVLRAMRERLRGPRLLALAMVLGDFDSLPLSFLDVPVQLTAYPADQLTDVVSAAGFEVTSIQAVTAQLGPDYTETQLYVRAVAR